jgi:NAD(P)-dependent dehydrogenase (short-subunit alcohol dehydrogenase family)
VELRGSVCLVTGASSGIGAALVRALSARGATVAAAARRTDLLAGLGAASSHRVDLSDPADALRLADEVVGAHGRVDVLVNNAGVRVDGTVAEVSLEDLDRSFQVNALSPFVLAGGLAPGMVERGSGVIANVVAPQVSGGRRGMGAYAASKAALESLTQTLRQEIGAGKGVAVFAFDPGWVRTDLAPDGPEDPAAAAERLAAHVQGGRSAREILS